MSLNSATGYTLNSIYMKYACFEYIQRERLVYHVHVRNIHFVPKYVPYCILASMGGYTILKILNKQSSWMNLHIPQRNDESPPEIQCFNLLNEILLAFENAKFKSTHTRETWIFKIIHEIYTSSINQNI